MPCPYDGVEPVGGVFFVIRRGGRVPAPMNIDYITGKIKSCLKLYKYSLGPAARYDILFLEV